MTDLEQSKLDVKSEMTDLELDALIREHIEEYVLYGVEPKDRESFRRSHHVLLSEDLMKVAGEYALSHAYSSEQLKDLLFEETVRFLDYFAAIVGDPFDDSFEKQFNYLPALRPSIDELKAGKVREIMRSDMEQCAGEYLAFPFRSERVDRALVRCLIASEMFSFFKEIYVYPKLMATSRFAKMLIGLSHPSTRERQLAMSMLETYYELDAQGPISAIRVRELAVKSANLGVAWPPALFALLDDIAGRTGRM
ncbi:hypothetical protein [Cohaesibacter marisflavi]|uniref:hypothetical protein n=1 Tax=Cohaesibacter marisflavi TaxID=655353 RepID=UPI0029C8139B|nr:hypothetical protein [Cohaesibacter marisflavi]